MARDDFPPAVIEALGKRVGYFCSNPECGRPTVGPHTSPAKWVMLGVAAHITAAASGGKRYDSNLTPEKRKEISNGIWLCQICGKLIDSDELKYKKEVILKWKADKEAEIEANVTRGVVADVNGPPLAVSDRLMMGYIANVQIDDGSIVPCAYIPKEGFDPTRYAAAFAFRLVVRPVQTVQPTFILGVGVEIVSVALLPDYYIRRGVYPAGFSLYLVEFDDPKIDGTNRFMAEKYFRISSDGASEGVPFQAIVLDAHIPDVIDCRLSPRSPGLYSLRLFASVSVGTTLKEQDLIKELKVLVPEPTNME
jgi:hypothetical protein